MMRFFTTIRWYLVFSNGPQILLTVLLVGIAARDFREQTSRHVQYRWTHWLGIAILVWNAAVSTVYTIWWVLFREFP